MMMESSTKSSEEYYCSNCDRTYSNRSNYTKHLKKIHGIKQESDLMCTYCKKSYQTKYKLTKHVKNKHENVLPTKKSNLKCNQCETCGKVFCTNIRLNRHIKSVHLMPKKAKRWQNRIVCPFDSCQGQFDKLSDLRFHALTEHAIPMATEEHILKFDDMQEFGSWKHGLEENTGIRYFTSRICNDKKGTKQFKYYMCNRSFNKRSEAVLKKTRKKGSIKMGAACTSCIILRKYKNIEKNAISVTYYPTHVGHDCLPTISAHLDLSVSVITEGIEAQNGDKNVKSESITCDKIKEEEENKDLCVNKINLGDEIVGLEGDDTFEVFIINKESSEIPEDYLFDHDYCI